HARRLRVLANDERVQTSRGRALVLPAVSPHHVGILSGVAGGCPAGPPRPARSPRDRFVNPIPNTPTPPVPAPHTRSIRLAKPDESPQALDDRVTLVDGERLDTTTNPPSWQPDKPDGVDTDGDGRLDGVAGHGTFIAGLIASACPQAELTVVGLRNQEVEIEGTRPSEQSGRAGTMDAYVSSMMPYS